MEAGAAGSTVGKGYGLADFISSAVQGRGAPGLTAELMFLVLADLADLAFFFIGMLPNVVGRELAVAHCAYVVPDVCGFNTLADKTAAK